MDAIQSVINEYLLHCRFEKRLSVKTIKAYSIDLAQFHRFLITINVLQNVSEITKESIRRFFLNQAHLKPKSLKRKNASIKAFFNFLECEDMISINPLRKMRLSVKEEKTLPNVMTLEEISKILKVAYNEKTKHAGKVEYSYIIALRDIVVIELLFSTGARVSEIANLKTSHINLSNGNLLIRGKGNKERIIQICNGEVLQVAKEYARINSQSILDSGNYFLTNRFGNALSEQSIRIIVKRFKELAGISRQITPHIFRHSFATLLLEKDVDIKYIQALLGHSSISTTQIYTHVSTQKQRMILKSKHPRRELKMIMSAHE